MKSVSGIVAFFASVASWAAAKNPECTFSGQKGVLLGNAAAKDVCMPYAGIGTGAYNHDGTGTGEWWNNTVAATAIEQWLKIGGRRIDTSYTYGDQPGIGVGMANSGIPRHEIFVTSKVGPGNPLGFNETLMQFDQVLATLGNQTYVDLLLVHWPDGGTKSSDPACTGSDSSPRKCRQSVWKALEEIFRSGRARAIGVSNYEKHHIKDVLDLGGLKPAVDQCEYHPFFHEDDLVAYVQSEGIQFNSYAPLGAYDHAIPAFHWPHSCLEDPVIQKAAKAHDVTSAQVVLQWNRQQGIVWNPRSTNPQHMKDNLLEKQFSLTEEEMKAVASEVQVPANHPKVCPNPQDMP